MNFCKFCVFSALARITIKMQKIASIYEMVYDVPISVKCSWIHPSLALKLYPPLMDSRELSFAKIKNTIGERRWNSKCFIALRS